MPEDFVIDNLQGILDSIELIETRFVGVANSDGFVLNGITRIVNSYSD